MKKRRIIIIFYCACCIILGVVSVIIGLYNSDHKGSFFAGLGFGLIIGGAIKMIYNISILKSKELYRKKKIEEEDERNILFAYQASHYTYMFAIMAVYAFLIYLVYTKNVHIGAFSIAISSTVIIRQIIYVILKKFR